MQKYTKIAAIIIGIFFFSFFGGKCLGQETKVDSIINRMERFLARKDVAAFMENIEQGKITSQITKRDKQGNFVEEYFQTADKHWISRNEHNNFVTYIIRFGGNTMIRIECLDTGEIHFTAGRKHNCIIFILADKAIFVSNCRETYKLDKEYETVKRCFEFSWEMLKLIEKGRIKQ